MRKLIVFLILLLPFQAEAGLRKLKQSTATAVNVHLVTATTGAGITGATIGSIAGFVRKHSDTTSTTVTAVTFSGSELGRGAYSINLTAAHTDTLGDLTLCYGYTAAVDTCDTYEVSAASDPQFLGDYASTADLLAELCADITTVGSWGKRICDNVDAPISTIEPVIDTASIATAVWDYIIETGWTAAELTRVMSGTLIGKASGFNTNTPTYRDVNDTKDRLTSTTNNTGRTSVTYDKTP